MADFGGANDLEFFATLSEEDFDVFGADIEGEDVVEERVCHKWIIAHGGTFGMYHKLLWYNEEV